MSELFLTVLNMSLTASYVILFVILVRLLLKKAPKVISYALWGVVAFRLIIPFSFESIFSLMPRNTNTVPIPHDIIYQQSPKINSGIEVVDSFVSQSLPAPTAGASANPLQIYVEIGAYIWVLGIIALLVYSLISVLILKRQLKSAQLIERNIYESKNLKTPFVLGLIKPRIYLPVGLSKEERNYTLFHEQTHIHRKDHILKILAFLILAIHWFNPLVWIAFMLMSTDMELSCDERVLKEMNEDIKKPYANSLLSLATGRHILNGSPLAFGEGNVKGRIKNVLNYRKPRFWVIAVTGLIAIALYVGLMANPKSLATFNGSSYRVEEILYQDPVYSFGYTLDTAPQYSISSDYMLYSKQITDNDWVMHKGLYPYKISRQELYALFNPLNNKAHEAIDQTKLIYRSDTDDENEIFYLIIQLKNGDVLLALGYDNEDNRRIRWLFRLEEIGDRNGFSLTDQEVARMLGYSSAYCFSTYEMDNGLYIIGFLADGEAKHSDIGAGLFKFKDGEYQLISQTIHKGQALEQDRIVVGMLIAHSNTYYDVILSNNENLAEIRRTSGGKVVSEKVDHINPSMTVIKLPEILSEATYTFYDASGQRIDGYIPAETTKRAESFEIQNATKVELRSGNTGNTVEITDTYNIQQITKAINSLQYEKGKSSNNSTGWSYSIKWYDKDGVLIEEIVILGSQNIDYKGKLYTALDGNIDTELLDDLLSKSANKVSLLTSEQQKAVNNSINYIKNSSFTAKDRINTNTIKIGSADEKTWEFVWSKDSKVENNAVDSTDWIITIGDTSNHDFAVIVCDSNTYEVIGYIPIE